MAETPFSPQPRRTGLLPLPHRRPPEGPRPPPLPCRRRARPPERRCPGPRRRRPWRSRWEAAQPESPRPEAEPEPGITATLEVPALEATAGGAGAEGGGEFDLLLGEDPSDWFDSGELKAQWQRLQGPLKGLAILVGVVLLLRVYGS